MMIIKSQEIINTRKPRMAETYISHLRNLSIEASAPQNAKRGDTEKRKKVKLFWRDASKHRIHIAERALIILSARSNKHLPTLAISPDLCYINTVKSGYQVFEGGKYEEMDIRGNYSCSSWRGGSDD